MRNDGIPHPDYPGLGVRAKEGDVVIREDWPAVPPTYEDGTPIQLYDKVRVSDSSLKGVHTVTEISIRCWGRPGRYQTRAGTDDEGRTRWFDHPEEQVWIAVDGKNYVLRADQLRRA